MQIEKPRPSKIVSNPKIVSFVKNIIGLFNCVPDSIYLKIIFRLKVGYKLNLKNPRTFNEKLQWLKLHDRKPEYTQMVDKYAVREYIKNTIGEEYLIPLLGVWEKFDDIDFDTLPDQFVLKCNHDSGSAVICKDKSHFNISDARDKINRALSHNYYYLGREYPYKNVPAKIIAEKYMSTSENLDLIDYKIMCFNGKVKCAFTCTNRRSKNGLNVTFFDTEWNKFPFERHYPMDHEMIPKPESLDEMLSIAERISQDLNTIFVRIDFYDIDNKIYFGEFTLYPGGGMEEFTPFEWDEILGSWISLKTSD